MVSAQVKQAAAALEAADAMVVSAGAGMGVDSGLPDFRGRQGFWRAYPPIAKLGLSFSQMADPGWFETRPRLAWAFYGHRLNLYRRTRPHAGFRRLLSLAEGKRAGYFVFTSNVDGQFQAAGYDDERIVECHGSIHHFQCVGNCSGRIWPAYDIEVSVDDGSFEALEPLPSCSRCGGLARPNILMFGDWGWISDRTGEQERRFQDWLLGLSRRGAKVVVVEVGAGHAVPTVRMLSESLIRRFSATLVRINPRDHAVPPGQISIPLGGAEGIGRVCAEIKAS